MAWKTKGSLTPGYSPLLALYQTYPGGYSLVSKVKHVPQKAFLALLNYVERFVLFFSGFIEVITGLG
jgi:hypothetical protein